MRSRSYIEYHKPFSVFLKCQSGSETKTDDREGWKEEGRKERKKVEKGGGRTLERKKRKEIWFFKF